MNDIAPAKYMRPKPFAVRTGVSGRTVYHWIDLKIIPSYKFQGVLLIDIEEADLIIKGLRRHAIKAFRKSKRQQKDGVGGRREVSGEAENAGCKG